MSFIRTSGNDVIPGLDPMETNGLELISEQIRLLTAYAYEVFLKVVASPTKGDEVAGVSGTVTLPPGGSNYPDPKYVVGSNTLRLTIYGEQIRYGVLGTDYVEVGTPGSESNSVQWLIPIVPVTGSPRGVKYYIRPASIIQNGHTYTWNGTEYDY